MLIGFYGGLHNSVEFLRDMSVLFEHSNQDLKNEKKRTVCNFNDNKSALSDEEFDQLVKEIGKYNIRKYESKSLVFY